MSDIARRRVPSEVLKRGYSDDEVNHIYELGKLFLESGDMRRGEAVMMGLTEVVMDFAPAWLGLAYVHIQNKNFDAAISAAKAALKIDPDIVEATLYLITCLMQTGDFNAAGTYLGEVGERLEMGRIENPNTVRFFKSQLARYQGR